MHVTQRGVNRCAIFLDSADRIGYRRLLHDACDKYDVAVHGFVLMDNHVHLLLTPQWAGAMSRAMRWLGQNHVQSFNARHGRCGTLWQGRFKSCLVDSDRHALNVLRYIELNPLRAAMVGAADDYHWSSVHAHVGRVRDPRLTPHPAYLALGADAGARGEAYRSWLAAGIDADDLTRIRRHLAQERALGDDRFQRMLAKTLNLPVACRPRGRPRALEPLLP